MTDTQTTKGGFFDTFLTSTPGGLWNDKDVEILSAKFGLQSFVDKNGVDRSNPDLGPTYKFIVEGRVVGEERTRKEHYGIGKAARPSADGESIVTEKGGPTQPAQLHEKSQAARFFKDLKTAGYDLSKLYDEKGQTKVSNLAGAIIRFKGEVKTDLEGKPIKQKNNPKYDEYISFPVLVVGQAKSKGNGAATSKADAEAAVTLIINELKTLPRPMLARELLKRDFPDGLVNLAIDDTFLKTEAGWKYDGRMITAA